MDEQKEQRTDFIEESKDISDKNCGCNYTGGKKCYPEHIKQKTIKYYLEGNGFKRNEKLMHVRVQYQ